MHTFAISRTSFIDTHFINKIRLIINSYRVRVIDSLSSCRAENLKRYIDSNAIEPIIDDLKDPCTELRSTENVNIIFHFVTNPKVRVNSIDLQTHSSENIVETFKLLKAMRNKGMKEAVKTTTREIINENNIS